MYVSVFGLAALQMEFPLFVHIHTQHYHMEVLVEFYIRHVWQVIKESGMGWIPCFEVVMGVEACLGAFRVFPSL